MSTVKTTKRTLTARAYRDGKWWTIKIPELTSPSPRGGDTRITATGQARSVKDIDAAARDIAAVWLDVDEDQIEVQVTVEIPPHAAELWTLAKKNEEDARAAVAEAARLNREAVKALTADGLSQADTARILGLSPQRISQLTH
ncbi:antitoxin HicB [Cryobacterium lactosi]|uniref:Antitoxin HicB n=1 Tax=Cryobacterium lactosi TaxID=1259202 RepID=A0A4R9BWK8_9MICO|nr:antitoxin HicB [Cryobacterium lactosi]TFD92957.1 antitoxin HicB [Cryobacterium lactosi]